MGLLYDYHDTPLLFIFFYYRQKYCIALIFRPPGAGCSSDARHIMPHSPTFTCPTLEYLARIGRQGRCARLLASLLRFRQDIGKKAVMTFQLGITGECAARDRLSLARRSTSKQSVFHLSRRHVGPPGWLNAGLAVCYKSAVIFQPLTLARSMPSRWPDKRSRVTASHRHIGQVRCQPFFTLSAPLRRDAAPLLTAGGHQPRHRRSHALHACAQARCARFRAARRAPAAR